MNVRVGARRFFYRNLSVFRLFGGICQQLFSVVCKILPCFEKTSAESGVNVGMFSEICLDVFLSFVQKIKMFVQKQKGSCRAEIKNDSRNLC